MKLSSPPRPAASHTPSENQLEALYRRTYANLRALEHALLAGQLIAARAAFARLQEAPALSEALSRNPFPSGNHRLRALQDLGRCLLEGDLSGAKAAGRRFL